MNFDRVVNKLLEPADLNIDKVQIALTELLKPGIDFGDIYFQNKCSESWYIEDSIVKSGSYSICQGMGVRAITGEKTGFSYSDEISINALKQTVRTASGISRKGQDKKIRILNEIKGNNLYQPLNPLKSLEREQKIKLLQEMDVYARTKCPEIKQFTAYISSSYENILIAATDGTLAVDIRPFVRISCSVVVNRNGRTESGHAGGGARLSYNYFFENIGEKTRAMSYVDEAIRVALVNLDSIEAPAGVFPVVLAAGWAGVLIHEAVGHGLEGDSCRKGESIFANLENEKVAANQCTIVDDGTIENARGSISIDDEGVPSCRNVLIENGILKNFMYDKHSAFLVGKKSTGNGRRESYSSIPITRMTNTYMLPGSYDPEEIKNSVKRGIYAVNFGGGQVNPTSGKFVFTVDEAYIIENGKITRPIKGVTLIGDSLDIMKKVSMVGNDLKLDPGIGSCGKQGQSVPVGIGIPTLKIEGITVGGTK